MNSGRMDDREAESDPAMSDEPPTARLGDAGQASPVDAANAAPEPLVATINAQTLLRLLLVLLTIWTAFSGLALVFFQSAADATIGGGLDGGDGEAAQRLLGIHLLVLAPIYGLLVWRPAQYSALRWVPYAAQVGVVVVTAFDIITLDRDFLDGALPLIVATTFLVLFLYVWYAGRTPLPPDEEEEGSASVETLGALETPAAGSTEGDGGEGQTNEPGGH
ncbi:MAG: hypothetical protein IIC90_03830 [Chloroflexi bacterium]|nr:hypothetical protein [Chloroflexota bacterium]